ncbi:MAG: sulfite exporter TauE/SafE family protein [Burkholderiales bacterium]|nr:sulfite exporter TauE/SafE family protein [Burkholderiales bacterium]
MFPFDQAGAALAGFAIIALGYVIFGMSGFGASLITIPVLSHFYPMPFVLVVALLLDVGSGFVMGIRRRRDAEMGELKVLLPFSVIGAVLGTTLLLSLPREAALIALGTFIGGYGLYGLAEPAHKRALTRRWAPLAGVLGGATGTLFGMGGPPYLIYLTRRVFDKQRLLATMSVTVALNLVIRLVVFAAAGVLLQSQILLALAWFVPAAALGLWLGGRLHLRLSHASLLRVLYAVLFGCGVSLIVRTGLLVH